MAERKDRFKTYRADFFAVFHGKSRKHQLVKQLLATGSTAALALDDNDEEKFQIRSIVPIGGGKAFKAVFGRCRFGEKPIQGAEDGREEEVELKPGHGLVEKNHFLFFADRNLLVYQRNPTGSHHSRFQRYLSAATEESLQLEPVLTRDSYERLLSAGAHARRVEISFQQPRDPKLYNGDDWSREAIELVEGVGGINAKITISVGRTNHALLDKAKAAAVTMARRGLAKVARVQLEDEAEPIDLIADRISEPFTVKLQSNGRPDPEDVYAALQKAELHRSRDIKAFFG